eukprot:Mycagemm_TRINITY_DN10248_c0_g1::TRINITY_DN10248_c0_g1_i2::g.4065::m.4065 type:complete len:101 gc:universal TRINITY_DN10248_c0_g1_i2:437-739(+)
MYFLIPLFNQRTPKYAHTSRLRRSSIFFLSQKKPNLTLSFRASNRSTRLTTAPGGPSAVPTKHFGRIASLILARSSPCSAGPRTSTCASLAGCSTTTATP